MKLNFSLLAAVIQAEGTDSSPGDIRPYLDALQSYCKDIYGLPAFNTGKLSRTEFANKWKHRNDFETNFNKK